MKDTLEVLRNFVSAQLPVSAFLAVLMWSLHARLRRQEFNRWWVSAWTLSALFLATSSLSLSFPPGRNAAKDVVVLLTTLTGFLVAPVLVFGALSFRPSATITRPLAFGGLGTALVLGALSFAASLQWSDPVTSFAVRHGPRTLALAGALFFCSWVFFQRVRATRSWAAMLTSGSCFLYAAQSVCVHSRSTRSFLRRGDRCIRRRRPLGDGRQCEAPVLRCPVDVRNLPGNGAASGRGVSALGARPAGKREPWTQSGGREHGSATGDSRPAASGSPPAR